MKFEQCNRVNVLMSSYNKPWFIAGGWAIDLFIGKQTRPHHDLEIAIFRKD
ncbi:nucleotidyltransferase domain-containing protein [Cytobacillus sp. Hm23]